MFPAIACTSRSSDPAAGENAPSRTHPTSVRTRPRNRPCTTKRQLLFSRKRFCVLKKVRRRQVVLPFQDENTFVVYERCGTLSLLPSNSSVSAAAEILTQWKRARVLF